MQSPGLAPCKVRDVGRAAVGVSFVRVFICFFGSISPGLSFQKESFLLLVCVHKPPPARGPAKQQEDRGGQGTRTPSLCLRQDRLCPVSPRPQPSLPGAPRHLAAVWVFSPPDLRDPAPAVQKRAARRGAVEARGLSGCSPSLPASRAAPCPSGQDCTSGSALPLAPLAYVTAAESWETQTLET